MSATARRIREIGSRENIIEELNHVEPQYHIPAQSIAT